MKKERVKQRKRISNLPKYDLANKTIDPGYQLAVDDTPIGSFENVAAIPKITRGELAAQGITQGVLAVTPVLSSLLSLKKTGATAGTAAAETTAKGAASGANAGLSTTLGVIGGGLAALTGSAQMAQGVNQIKHSLSGDDIRGMSSTSTQYGIGGRQYKYMHSPGQSALNYANQQIKQGLISTTLGGFSAGAGVGSAVGSLLPVPIIGTAIGAGAGALIGGLTSWITGHNAKERNQNLMDNVTTAYDQYNRQGLAMANTLGLRDEFRLKHGEKLGISGDAVSTADEGKVPGGNMGRKKKRGTGVTEIETPEGEMYAPVDYANSYVQKGEPLFRNVDDPENITAHVVQKGEVGVDNRYSIAQDGDNIAIGAHGLREPNTGMRYSELLAGPANAIESINNALEKQKRMSDDKTTQEVQNREATKAKNKYIPVIQELLDSQKEEQMKKNLLDYNKFNWGKLPEYDDETPQSRAAARRAGMPVDGNVNEYSDFKNFINAYSKMMPNRNTKFPNVMAFMGSLPQFGASLALYFSYKNDPIVARRTYTSNNNTKAAFDAMRPYKDYTALNDVNNAYLQALYGTRTGGGSLGLKMLMTSALNANRMNAAASARNQINEAYAKQMQAYGDALYKAGEADRQAWMGSEAAYNDAYAKAVAKRRLGMETGMAGMAGSMQDLAKNSMNNYWTNANIGLYYQNMINDAYKNFKK